MPYVKIELLKGRSEEQKARIAEAVTAALVEHAGATAESTFIVFDDVEAWNWAGAGRLMSRKPSPPIRD